MKKKCDKEELNNRRDEQKIQLDMWESTLEKEVTDSSIASSESKGISNVQESMSTDNNSIKTVEVIKKLPLKAKENTERERIIHDNAVNRLSAIEKKRVRFRYIALFATVSIVLMVTILTANIVLTRKNSEAVLQFLKKDSIGQSYESEGIIVRDDVIYSAGVKGIVKPIKPEATKVGKTEAVAMVLSDKNKANYEIWNNLGEQISKRRLELISQGQGLGAAKIFKDTDIQMTAVLDELRQRASRSDMSNLKSIQNTIDSYIYSRNIRLRTVSFNDEQLEALVEQQKLINDKLMAGSVYLFTDASGYISYMTDGREATLNTNTVAKILPEHISEIIGEGEKFNTIPRVVKNKEPAYRLSKNTSQTLLLIIHGASLEDFEKNMRFTIELPKEDIRILNCSVQKAVEYNDGIYVVANTSSQVEKLIDRRILSGRVIIDHEYGYRVANHVLMNYNESSRQAELMVVVSGITKKIPINVNASNEKYSVISDIEGGDYLKEGAIYVENPQRIKEGITIE